MGNDPEPRWLDVADDYSQLVFDALAQLTVAGPGSIFDRRYRPLAPLPDGDTALLTRLWLAEPDYDVLHGLYDLHGDLEQCLAAAGRPLTALDADAVADPALLRSLQHRADKLPGIEILRADLALSAPGFALALQQHLPALRRACDEIRPWLERLRALVPALAERRVELVHALGMHGRASPRRILVGAPGGWCGCTAARQAVLAAHEASTLAVQGDHCEVEWRALSELARTLRDVDPDLRGAHADWLASLELTALARIAVERGWISASRAEVLIEQPLARGEVLGAG